MEAEFHDQNRSLDDSTDMSVRNDQEAGSELPISLREKVSRIWQSTKEDYAKTDRKGKLIIGGFITNIGYELFIGNEVVAPLLGGQTLDSATGLGGVAASAAITAMPVYLQQRAGGYLSRSTAQRFPAVSAETYQDLDDGATSTFKSFGDLSLGKRAFYSFVLGSTFNVTREAIVTGNTDDEVLKPVEKASARTTAAMVAIMAGSANIVNQQFQDNDTVQAIMDHGVKNPLFWLSAGVILLAKDSIQSRRERSGTVKNRLTPGDRET